MYGVLDYSSAKNAIMSVLFTPAANGAALAAALAAAEKGDGAPLAGLTTRRSNSEQFVCSSADVAPPTFASGFETLFPIRCGDQGSIPLSVEQVEEVYERMAQDSSTFAEMWSVYTACG